MLLLCRVHIFTITQSLGLTRVLTNSFPLTACSLLLLSKKYSYFLSSGITITAAVIYIIKILLCSMGENTNISRNGKAQRNDFYHDLYCYVTMHQDLSQNIFLLSVLTSRKLVGKKWNVSKRSWRPCNSDFYP
jgi:hypothetical protein